ncbi:hypothetical protein DAY19_08395 [Halobacteriovorax vibrionivorans]|uniref:TM2 domain-containing protein n=1 Tax=Halobacteriovorax vibrionivorans TaxID=2152716 RepID=A0ABY0IFI9_9BACT|nr:MULTISPECIES: hypothetical protein [Halobacteriovorax]RZF21698.1 hypothetical protein DAY19_08395 [Halobacteriovorax vibrionivorans]TGD49009.1 hypothetical protein EP118_00645 [Halobacteriovorax sp. Y22]
MSDEQLDSARVEKVYIIQKESHSRGVAAVLSFLIPGLGQLYKGQFLNSIAWFCLTLAGYFFFFFPGLILHLLCILGAMSGKNNETVEIKQ